VNHSLPFNTTAIFGEGQGSVFAPVATVHHGRLPSSSVKCHFWQGCVGVSRCMPHHPNFFFWSPLCIYTARFVFGVANVSETAPWRFTVAFPCLYMVLYFFWPMDASFVQTGECPPSWDSVELLYSYIPWPFCTFFYVCRYTRFLSFIFVLGTSSLSIFLVILWSYT